MITTPSAKSLLFIAFASLGFEDPSPDFTPVVSSTTPSSLSTSFRRTSCSASAALGWGLGASASQDSHAAEQNHESADRQRGVDLRGCRPRTGGGIRGNCGNCVGNIESGGLD